MPAPPHLIQSGRQQAFYADANGVPTRVDPTNRLPVQATLSGALASVTGTVTTKETRGTSTFAAHAPTSTAAQVKAANSTRVSLMIRNVGDETVWIGKDSGVTTANGFPLYTGDVMIEAAATDARWAITSAGIGDLRTIEVAT